MASSSQLGTVSRESVSSSWCRLDFINLLSQYPTLDELVVKSIGDENDKEVIVEDVDGNEIIHIKDNQLILSSRCQVPVTTLIQMLPMVSEVIVEDCFRLKRWVRQIEAINKGKDCPIRITTTTTCARHDHSLRGKCRWLSLPQTIWYRIMPLVSDEDNTNLAEVFPDVALLIRKFVIAKSNQSHEPTAKGMKLLNRCPNVAELVVIELAMKRKVNFRFMKKIAEINPNLESIRFGHRFELELPKQYSRLRYAYVERIWEIKGTVDTFKSPVEFHYTLGRKYHPCIAEMDKRIEFKSNFNYDKIENWKLIHVTEILVSEDSDMVRNLITRCPNLRLLQVYWLGEGWTTLPHNPALKRVVGSSQNTSKMLVQEIATFLDVISNNTENLEDISFYRSMDGIKFFHIKKNMMTITTRYEVPLSKLVEMFPRIRTILVEKLRKPSGGVTRILNQVEVINNGVDEKFTVVTDKPKFFKLCRRRVEM